MLKVAFEQASLTEDQQQALTAMWRRCVRRIIVSTTLAGSGHPGGSMSSLHALLMLYATLRHDPGNPCWAERDRLLVSMGHISPGVYSVLCEFGYVREEDLFLGFRRAGSAFAGHVETCVPGVEWNTGNLGQGLSAGTGMALAQRLRKSEGRTVVLMGDGEQQKGQIAEARRFAVKYGLNNLFVVIDRNHLQIGGDTSVVMPQAIEADYVAAQWNVITVKDGHDFGQLFQALRRIFLREVDDPSNPTVVVAETVMGKGVSFMEHKAKYHGSALPEADAAKALEELGLDNPIPLYRERRNTFLAFDEGFCAARPVPVIEVGEPRTYGVEVLTDNRSAYGAVLEDLAARNNDGEVPGVLCFSCDLEGSVKMDGFHKRSKEAFFESGIQEHHAATLAGAASREGFVVFFSTFGVFGVGETYNQQRLNDINQTQLKLVCTHVGLDVGEDGQTHQCLDYLGLLQNLYDFSLFMPADPNQTDRIIRYVAAHSGNFFVGMGRSKLKVICDESGAPRFGGDYRFVPGRADWVRQGHDGAILSYGMALPHALQAREDLAQQHQLKLALLNFASLRPLDQAAILHAAETGLLVTVEDHHVDTGLGARVAAVLADHGRPCRLVRLGVKRYGLSGLPADLYRLEGIDAVGIVRAVLQAKTDGSSRT